MKTLIYTLAVAAAAFGQGPDGNDISTAVPIYVGQVVKDIGDASLSPDRLYKIALGRGQKLSLVVATDDNKRVGWNLRILRGSTKTIKSLASGDLLLQAANVFGFLDRYDTTTTYSVDYQVPTAGDYFIWVRFYVSNASFKLETQADGIPLDVTLPAEAGCLAGQVDHITFSLRFISLNLPDELSIGGSRVCANCTVKPPLYSAIVEKLEAALKAGVPVEACHDDKGNIIKVKMQRP